MIHEEICTYEVCKLAKEKGFRETVGWYYNTNGLKLLKRGCNGGNPNLINGLYSAPTQSLLQRWLREEKRIDIEIYPIYIEGVTKEYMGCIYAPQLNNPKKVGYFNTYELTLEGVLKYALEKLV